MNWQLEKALICIRDFESQFLASSYSNQWFDYTRTQRFAFQFAKEYIVCLGNQETACSKAYHFRVNLGLLS